VLSYFQVPTEGDKKISQSSVVTVIHMEGLDKLNKVRHTFGNWLIKYRFPCPCSILLDVLYQETV